MNATASHRRYVNRLFSEENIVISSTSGRENIADASDVFASIERDFREYADVIEDPTDIVSVKVFEIIHDGNFAHFFSSFEVDNISQLCLTQHQIKLYVKGNPDKFNNSGYITFFLTRTTDEYFIVGVGKQPSGSFSVGRHRFSSSCTWSGGLHHSLVVPGTVIDPI